MGQVVQTGPITETTKDAGLKEEEEKKRSLESTGNRAKPKESENQRETLNCFCHEATFPSKQT